MNEPLDELYLTWLYSQICSLRLKNPVRTYWSFARQLYTMEFIWLIPNDDNRLEDGKDLRYEFLDEEGIDEVDPDWMSLGCSVLEMMLGLSRRLSFEAEGKPRDWFWHLVENLGLTHLNDKDYDDRTRELVDETFGRVIFRLYERNGQGGLFPLRHPKENQQNVELWYQLSAYLLENELTRGG